MTMMSMAVSHLMDVDQLSKALVIHRSTCGYSGAKNNPQPGLQKIGSNEIFYLKAVAHMACGLQAVSMYISTCYPQGGTLQSPVDHTMLCSYGSGIPYLGFF